MGCIIFILVILLIGALIASAYIGACIVVGIIFIGALVNFIRSRSYAASTMVCPNCGSNDVFLHDRQSGTDAVGPVGSNTRHTFNVGSGSTRIKYERIAKCNKCGFSWNYYTAEDVSKAKSSATVWFVVSLILFIALLFPAINSAHNSDKQDTAAASSYSTSSEEAYSQTEFQTETNTETTAASELDDFQYELSGSSVILDSVKSDKDRIIVRPSYTVDGTSYTTDLSDFQVTDSDVKTIIFDDGITGINVSTFNGCNVRQVYFPSSMTLVYDYTLSYMHPDDDSRVTVYYEGTEEEWDAIFTEYAAKDVDEVDSPEDKGKAFADKVNKMLGSEYDPTDFNFVYSATQDMVQ